MCVWGGEGGRGGSDFFFRFFFIYFLVGGSFSLIFLTVDKFLKLTSEFSCFA